MASQNQDAVLSVQNVEKLYGSVRALGPISFELGAGAQVALLGESGSGKSTLLNLIGCMDTPTRGQVLLKGHGTNGLSDRELSQLRLTYIGYVHQFFDLLSDLSALDNVQLPLWMAGRAGSETIARGLLSELGLEKRLNQLASVLSGGEQQRVAIARALSLGPSLILADEPSGSLDSRTGEAVMDLLFRFSSNLGATLIVATHSPQAAERFSNYLRLKDGLLVDSQLSGPK